METLRAGDVVNQAKDRFGFKVSKLYQMELSKLVTIALPPGCEHLFNTLPENLTTEQQLSFFRNSLSKEEELAFKDSLNGILNAYNRSRRALLASMFRHHKINVSHLDGQRISPSEQELQNKDSVFRYLRGMSVSARTCRKLLPVENQPLLPLNPAPEQPASFPEPNPISHPEWFPISKAGSKIPPDTFERLCVNTGALPIVNFPENNSAPRERTKRRSWTQVSFIRVKYLLKDLADMFHSSPNEYTPWKPSKRRALAR